MAKAFAKEGTREIAAEEKRSLVISEPSNVSTGEKESSREEIVQIGSRGKKS
jgi:hypothetical protein